MFAKCVTKSCDAPDRLIQSCYQSVSLRATETASMTWSCAKCFQKCSTVENIIILSLNTVIPIIVMVWLSKVTHVSTDRLFIAVPCLLLYNVIVLSNAYPVLAQNSFFSSDVP